MDQPREDLLHAGVGRGVPGLDEVLGDDVVAPVPRDQCLDHARLGEGVTGIEATWFTVGPVRRPRSRPVRRRPHRPGRGPPVHTDLLPASSASTRSRRCRRTSSSTSSAGRGARRRGRAAAGAVDRRAEPPARRAGQRVALARLPRGPIVVDDRSGRGRTAATSPPLRQRCASTDACRTAARPSPSRRRQRLRPLLRRARGRERALAGEDLGAVAARVRRRLAVRRLSVSPAPATRSPASSPVSSSTAGWRRSACSPRPSSRGPWWKRARRRAAAWSTSRWSLALEHDDRAVATGDVLVHRHPAVRVLERGDRGRRYRRRRPRRSGAHRSRRCVPRRVRRPARAAPARACRPARRRDRRRRRSRWRSRPCCPAGTPGAGSRVGRRAASRDRRLDNQ